MKRLIRLFIAVILLLVLVWAINSCKKDTQVNLVTNMISYKMIPIVEAKLNGKNAFFILDTGASISVLDVTQLPQYGVVNTGISEMFVVGYGGVDNVNYDLDNPRGELGGIKLNQEFHGKNIKTIVETIRGTTGKKIVGIIGNNNIAGSRLILNFQDGTITR